MMDREESHSSQSSGDQRSRLWNFLGQKVPREEIVFFSQIILIYAVVITSLINITKGVEPLNLWISILSASVGYLLPNPSIKRKNYG